MEELGCKAEYQTPPNPPESDTRVDVEGLIPLVKHFRGSLLLKFESHISEK